MDELIVQVNLVMNTVNSLEEKYINDNIKIKKDRIGDYQDIYINILKQMMNLK